MENQEQNIRSWDDLIFENRNKAYGAYALRHDYSTELGKGLLTSIGVAVAVLVVAGIANTSTMIKKVAGATTEISIGPPPNVKSETIIPPQKSEPERRVKRDLTPVAVTHEPVAEPVEEPITTATGSEGTSNGTVTSGEGSSTGVDTGTDSGAGMVKSSEPYTHVEVMPAYKTGYEGMIKVLRKNLRYPNSAKHMGKEGIVYVEFVVNDAGEIRDVKVLRGFDRDCDKEAVRVVEKLTEWTPGFQNKMAVNVKLVLPIRFQLDHL